MSKQATQSFVILGRPLRMDRRAALDLLRRIAADRGEMLALRRLYAEDVARVAVHRLRDEEVIARLAERLASGALVAALLPAPERRTPPEAGSAETGDA